MRCEKANLTLLKRADASDRETRSGPFTAINKRREQGEK